MKLKPSDFPDTITDEFIKILYFTDKETINSNYLKSEWLEKHKDIHQYLLTRYNDSTCLKETLYRILCNIEKRPVCLICGNPVMFEPGHRHKRNRNGFPFLLHCSPECVRKNEEVINNRINTCLEKYNCVNPAQAKRIKEKIKETNIERYGVENVYQSDTVKQRIKETNLEKYGVTDVMKSKEFVRKAQQTNLEKYGVTSYAKSDLFKYKLPEYIKQAKDTNLERYGVDHFVKTEEYKKFYNTYKSVISEKQYNTKKKNNSFHISTLEEKLYDILSKEFGVTRQYKSPLYNYACDFYIKDLDLYIELNGTWTHGRHPYNPEKDKETLQVLAEKAKTSKYYDNHLKVWTIKDVEKRTTAKENNLNYLEIFHKYNIEDVPAFIKEHYNKNTKGLYLVIGEH